MMVLPSISRPGPGPWRSDRRLLPNGLANPAAGGRLPRGIA